MEQKNWTLVRRLIGYQRLDTQDQLQWLDSLYGDLLRPYNNCFQPVKKLIGKESVGNQVRKHYDRPTTPLPRVLDSGQADPPRSRSWSPSTPPPARSPSNARSDRRLDAMPAVLGVFRSA